MTTDTVPSSAGARPRSAFTWKAYTALFGGLAVVVVAAVAIGVWASSHLDKGPPRPDVIQYVLPPEGGAMMRQDRVGVSLEQGYGCVLVIDGIRIPEGQYVGVMENGECYFQAGPERMFEEFAPGRHEVAATVFPIGRPEERQYYRWSFQTQ